MDSISTAVNGQTTSQKLSHLVTTASAADTSANSDAQKGDQVTISEQGKQLAKAATTKGDGGTAAEASTSGLTVNKVKLNQTLQDAQSKQKSIAAKISQAKLQGTDVGGLNAQLTDAEKTVKKTQVEVNQ